MINRIQLKQFVTTILDLHRNNIIQLLDNIEFQVADQEQKEKAVEYITLLMKKEVEDHIDALLSASLN